MGGGQSAPTTTTVNQNTSNLPEYARPYFTSMMGQAQALTGKSNPYVQYGGQRLAGFTPEQQQVQQNILNQQMPGQFAEGSQLAGLSGLGSLTAGQRYAELGGPQSFTQAGTADQYMSPYIQNVLDIQKQQALRDAQQGQLAQNLGAARQGTYGGARQLLATTERERNLGTQMGQIEATGLQSAYENAVKQFNAEEAARLQNQQFGADLGLRGYTQANQSAQTLGNLGATQQQTQSALLGQQQATAAQQQALQQQYLDQQYKDFLAQRDYGKDNLAFYSSILHGVPVSPNTSTTQTTTGTAPSLGAQLMGTGLTALSAYNMVK
jgi:hypothetical protein